MQQLSFTKMHGLGNDFMVIDGVTQAVDYLTPKLIRAWADRHEGIGFDQLMLICPAHQTDVDFTYQIFNADGTEVEQCGNGVRCVAQFIHQKKLSTKKQLRLATSFATMICDLQDDSSVRVNMGQADFTPAALPFLVANAAPYYELAYHDRLLSFGAVSIGNPHIVFLVPDLAQAEVTVLGQFFNQHPAFPNGVNVGFMQIINRHDIKLRVYERGATETRACGTGSCAAVCLGQYWQLLDAKVCVHLTGGDLWIEQQTDADLLMTGPAISVFDGIITIP